MAKRNSRPNLAARKKAEKAAEEKKLAARKAYWESHKKQILTIAGIALVSYIVAGLASGMGSVATAAIMWVVALVIFFAIVAVMKKRKGAAA